jgi:hypothetical protein
MVCWFKCSAPTPGVIPGRSREAVEGKGIQL